MSLTITNREYAVFGSKRVIFCDIAFDSSYPTGGESLTASDIGLSVVEAVFTLTKSGYIFDYDYANEKLKAYYPSAGEESHTHAFGTLADAASAAGSAHQHAAITAETPAGTNAVSIVTPGNHATIEGITAGTPALTHNADPVSNLAAAALYIVEGYGVGNKNIGVLQSNCASTTSVLGSTDDAAGMCGAATPRFFVTHNGTPDGVAVFVDEADNDKLIFISPTETDAVVMMPFEAIADGIPGYAYAVTVHHKASMAGATALFFDDNGAADAQLAFVDTGASGGVIYASDITVVAPQYTGILGNSGSSAAQVFSGSALATHQHATENAHTHAVALDGGATGATTGSAGSGVEVTAATSLAGVTGVNLMLIGR